MTFAELRPLLRSKITYSALAPCQYVYNPHDRKGGSLIVTILDSSRETLLACPFQIVFSHSSSKVKFAFCRSSARRVAGVSQDAPDHLSPRWPTRIVTIHARFGNRRNPGEPIIGQPGGWEG